MSISQALNVAYMDDSETKKDPSALVQTSIRLRANLKKRVELAGIHRDATLQSAIDEGLELWVSDVYVEISQEAARAGLSVAEVIEQLWNTRKGGAGLLGKSRRPRRGYVEVPDYLEAKVRNLVTILSDPHMMGTFISLFEAMTHDAPRAAGTETPERQPNPIPKPNNG